MTKPRVGFGFDVHQLVAGRKLVLGGVAIPHTKGALGHSDADVLLHALSDALLGAAGMDDIGTLFPDTDQNYKDIDSRLIVIEVMEKLHSAKFIVGNIDATIVLENPKIKDFIPLMKDQIAHLLQINLTDISIKATTTEKLGFTGREEGVAAYVTVIIFD